MLKRDFYIGTIKKCMDLYSFEKFGESRYIGNCNTQSKPTKLTENFVKIIKTNAVLLKGKHDKYIAVDDIDGLKDLILFKIGKSHKIIHTNPSKDKELYIDNKSIKPFYDEENNKGKVKYKTLKKN